MNCVGIRYYSGVIERNEMAILEREPNNAYDSNAIRVLNLRRAQVGHIKKECAAKMAKVMDKGLARMECLVTGMSDGYNIPVTINVYCLPSMRHDVVMLLGAWLQTKKTKSSAKSQSSQYNDEYDDEYDGVYQKRVKKAQVTKEVEKLFQSLSNSTLALADQPNRVVTEVRFFFFFLKSFSPLASSPSTSSSFLDATMRGQSWVASILV